MKKFWQTFWRKIRIWFWLGLTIAIVVGLSIVVGRCQVHAASPRAVWDPSVGAQGYTLYYTDGITEYKASTTITEIPLSELNLVPGTQYTFTVTAYNDVGESPRSNAVVWTMVAYSPPTDQKPINIVIPSGVTITITAE